MTLRWQTSGIVLGLILSLTGCIAQKQKALEMVDKSMATIRPMQGLVGAPPPPLNINVDHVPVPFPVMPDPRTPLQGAEVWQLDLTSAVAVAIGNSEVVRTISGATTTMGGSTVGGAIGVPQNRANLSGGTTPGGPGTGGAGLGPAGLPGGGGGGVAGPAAIAADGGAFATVYDPAIAAARVESALGAFDASLSASMFWERLENPPGQTFGGFIATQPRLDTAYWRSSIVKPFVTGTVAAISFNNNYYFVPPPGMPPAVNPQYQSQLEFALIQPLLRGYGTQVGQAPILIAGAQANQSAWEFKRRMMAMVRSVETAYWELYAAQVNLQSIEDTLPLFAEVVRIEESRLKVDAAVPADVAQAQTDFLELRGQRLAAMAEVAQKQALLRNLLGLPPNDNRRIVLADRPLRAPVVIDWEETINVALDRRPDIIRQRLAVHVRELQLLVFRNALLPQLNAEGLYAIDGLGEDLNESLEVLGDNQFQDWRMGFSFEVPLGNHIAKGNLRAAQMQLLREQALLKQTAHIATHQLADIVRSIHFLQEQYEIAERRARANQEWAQGARARFVTPAAGVSVLQALDIYLRSIRATTTAATNSANLLAQYNIALAQLEEAKGTLLVTHNIFVYNDPCNAVQRTIFQGPYDHLDASDLAPDPNAGAEPITTPHAPMPPQAPMETDSSEPTDTQQPPAPGATRLPMPIPLVARPSIQIGSDSNEPSSTSADQAGTEDSRGALPSSTESPALQAREVILPRRLPSVHESSQPHQAAVQTAPTTADKWLGPAESPVTANRATELPRNDAAGSGASPAVTSQPAVSDPSELHTAQESPATNNDPRESGNVLKSSEIKVVQRPRPTQTMERQLPMDATNASGSNSAKQPPQPVRTPRVVTAARSNIESAKQDAQQQSDQPAEADAAQDSQTTTGLKLHRLLPPPIPVEVRKSLTVADPIRINP